MRLEHRIKGLEKILVCCSSGLTLRDWTDKEIDQAINLLLNGEEWPEGLQRKRETTCWPKDSIYRRPQGHSGDSRSEAVSKVTKRYINNIDPR